MPRPDLCPREFRHAVLEAGFAFLGRELNQYIDLQFPRRGPIPAVMDGKQIQRRATLSALMAARQAAYTEKAAAEATRLRLEGNAAKIAPTALPPVRADLTDEAAVAQLADDFILGTTTAEGVSFGALIRQGWRAEQLRQHGDAARALADRRQHTLVA